MEQKSENSSQPSANKPVSRKAFSIPHWIKLAVIALAMVLPVFVVSMILLVKTQERQQLIYDMSLKTEYNLGGAVKQMAPSLNAISSESDFYDRYNEEVESEYGYSLSPSVLADYVENTNLISTKGSVIIRIDQVKRGLRYEPAYSTAFVATYVLKNTLDTEAAVEFEFPFPADMLNKEINNALLLVDGVEQEKSVKVIESVTQEQIVPSTDPSYDYNWSVPYYPENTAKSGLFWEGTIPAQGQREIEVRYNTVGLGNFSYAGMENPEGSQDLSFSVKIIGSRKYDNLGSLTIDSREYIQEGEQTGVILNWTKPDLFSAPHIEVSVAPRVNPSEHLSEIYVIMVPLYFAFASAVILMVSLLKKQFGGVDMVLLASLFTIFFPLLHYLVSFNIDPSADVLANYEGVVNFSMPLYGAFAIALGVIGSLMVYLLGRVSGWSFSLGVGLPLIIVFMAFFPLAMTLPEYKYLLALIGVVAILGVVVQMRATRKIVRSIE